MNQDLARSLTQIQERISRALQPSSRPAREVTLVAVSKKKPAGLVREAFELGIHNIGENYVQELLQKQRGLSTLPIQWHFIGHLQRRKAKEIVGKVSLIHSVDSLELASEINRIAEKASLIQDCLIQVNLSGETGKSGISAQEAKPLLEKLKPLPYLRVLGLMTLPPYFENPEEARPFFKRLRELREELNRANAYSKPLVHLSMGMSHDFNIAIEEGATLVRVGSALFGER